MGGGGAGGTDTYALLVPVRYSVAISRESCCPIGYNSGTFLPKTAGKAVPRGTYRTELMVGHEVVVARGTREVPLYLASVWLGRAEPQKNSKKCCIILLARDRST